MNRRDLAPVVSDTEVLDALRRGDENAFRQLVTRHQAGMLRVARGYVPSQAVAEEVVQETWLAVIRGLDRFEGRSSLRHWMYSILINRAKTRGERERRVTPVALLGSGEEDAASPLSGERFRAEDPWRGHWASPPRSWEDLPSVAFEAKETRAVVDAAIGELPPNQQQVIVLRDLEGWSGQEVCDSMNITPVHQRVLLHRARTKVRAALEAYFDAGDNRVA